jgi:apolipoprotein N-acyltransferase
MFWNIPDVGLLIFAFLRPSRPSGGSLLLTFTTVILNGVVAPFYLCSIHKHLTYLPHLHHTSLFERLYCGLTVQPAKQIWTTEEQS